MKYIIYTFLIHVFVMLAVCTSVSAFEVEVMPYEVSPGDTFIISIRGNEISGPLVAVLNNGHFSFSSCGNGCFVSIGAIDLKTAPGIYRIELKAGEVRKEAPLLVRHTSFPETSLTLDRSKVFPDHEAMKRIEIEREKLKSIFSRISERLWQGSFMLPLRNEFSTGFGVKRIINKEQVSIHSGLDIRGKIGEEVRASNIGRVALAEDLFFGGNTVILDHGQGIYTVYMHLSGFMVRQDDMVSKKDVIGLVGSTGRASGPHLHFGVKVQGISANPVSLFNLVLPD